jgi:hypothetical protein
MKVLKVCKEARFKVFRTEEEARQFASSQLSVDTQPKAEHQNRILTLKL